MPLAVIAVGGNSLVQSNQIGTIAEQYANARQTCEKIADLVEAGWDVVLTHGNGPQVGNVLLRVEMAQPDVYPLPLDICDADTQGGMGYMLQQVLGNTLRHRGISRPVVTLVTQVLVDEQDPAFKNPTKPIGPFFTEAQAQGKIAEQGWQMREDSHRGWRRVVPSPKPRRIIEMSAVRHCAQGGAIPIAVGGGGIPVVEREGALYGVEAVIDKDLASALLAREFGADLLLISTGVTQVFIRFGTPEAQALGDVSREALRRYLEAGEFPPGSMGPKIQAALDFLDHGGKEVVITDPEHLREAVAGRAGTHVR